MASAKPKKGNKKDATPKATAALLGALGRSSLAWLCAKHGQEPVGLRDEMAGRLVGVASVADVAEAERAPAPTKEGPAPKKSKAKAPAKAPTKEPQKKKKPQPKAKAKAKADKITTKKAEVITVPDDDEDDEEDEEVADSEDESEPNPLGAADGTTKTKKEDEAVEAMIEFFPLGKEERASLSSLPMSLLNLRVLLSPPLWPLVLRRAPVSLRRFREPETRVLGRRGLQLRALLEERFPGATPVVVGAIVDDVMEAAAATTTALSEGMSWRTQYAWLSARIRGWKQRIDLLVDAENEGRFGMAAVAEVRLRRDVRARVSALPLGEAALLESVIKKTRTEPTVVQVKDNFSSKNYNNRHYNNTASNHNYNTTTSDTKPCDRCGQWFHKTAFTEHNKVCPGRRRDGVLSTAPMGRGRGGGGFAHGRGGRNRRY